MSWIFVSFVILAWAKTGGAAETIQSLYTQGEESYAHGDFHKAIELYEKVIELEPDFAPAYNALGLAHKEINTDLNEVAWLFKTATEIDPKFAQAYDNLGKAYYGLGEFDKAEDNCLKALELIPNLPSAQMSLAWIYLLGKSKPGQAIYYFQEFLKRNKAPYAYYGLGMAYFMNGDRPMVLDVITTLRSLQKDDLAMQLENMVRDKSYIRPQTEAPLVNTTSKERKPDSSLVKSGLEPMPAEVEGGGDQGQTMMKVRLRGKMFGTQAEKVAEAASSGANPSPPVVDSGIEKIKQMRGQSVSGSRPSNSAAMERIRAMQRQQTGVSY